MPKILVGWNLAIYRLLDLMFSAPSEQFSAPTRRNPKTVFPQWGSRRVDAYLSVDPKTLTRPRAVKTDRKSFGFSFFGSLRAISGSRRTIGSLRAFNVFRFSDLRSLDHLF